MEYKEFIKSKIKRIKDSGFDISESKLNKNLFDFQKYCVKTALKKGKYALFLDTGLGKTICQLDWAEKVLEHTHKPVLILAPLAVSGQTIQEGCKFGIKVWKLDSDIVIKRPNIDEHTYNRIYMTNYQQLDNIAHIIPYLGGVVLDESSILKNETAKYRTKIIELFKDTPYKLACTATPSPNDPMELGNHAEFLDVIKYNEMLAMYFIHDAGETQKWRLKGHSVQRFWEFVSSWAIMMMKPSDIGFNAKGYDLPPLNINDRVCKTPTPAGMLFGGLAVNATDFNASLRETEDLRIKEVINIVRSMQNEKFIIWCKQNQESDKIYIELKALGYDCRNVKGSDPVEKKELDLLGFANNKFQILITKSKIAQFGLNYQNCFNQIFASVDFSFESTYQSIRRSYRFGQDHEVNIWLVTTDRMINVVKAQEVKQKQFRDMQINMTKAVNKNINNITSNIMKSKNQVINGNYSLYQGDCVIESKKIKDHSVDLTLFSPPFAELYTYSSHVEDMGNSKDYDEFFEQFKYLVIELKRIMRSGRIVAIHCMDTPIQKGKEGYIGLRDFSGLLIKLFQDNDFVYHARTTIWKCPVIEMTRTKALGLLHKQIKKDSSLCRVGIPDYVLFFRAPGENETPIINQDTDHTKANFIPVELWQKIASPVWMDVDYSRTLNYRSAKGENDEKHICPLQLTTIERIILLYSNEGETVFDPFGGIGSTGYQALKMNRKSISIELKESYFDLNVKNHTNAIEEKGQLTLI